MDPLLLIPILAGVGAAMSVFGALKSSPRVRATSITEVSDNLEAAVKQIAGAASVMHTVEQNLEEMLGKAREVSKGSSSQGGAPTAAGAKR